MKIEAQSEHTLDFPRVSSSVEVHVNTSNIVLKIYIYIYIYLYQHTLPFHYFFSFKAVALNISIPIWCIKKKKGETPSLVAALTRLLGRSRKYKRGSKRIHQLPSLRLPRHASPPLLFCFVSCGWRASSSTPI
jgi:hypothetical protein